MATSLGVAEVAKGRVCVCVCEGRGEERERERERGRHRTIPRKDWCSHMYYVLILNVTFVIQCIHLFERKEVAVSASQAMW